VADATIPSPARSTGTTVISLGSRLPVVGSSGVSIETSTSGRSRAASTARIAEASKSAWRKSP
jgi:hypothetical protein